MRLWRQPARWGPSLPPAARQRGLWLAPPLLQLSQCCFPAAAAAAAAAVAGCPPETGEASSSLWAAFLFGARHSTDLGVGMVQRGEMSPCKCVFKCVYVCCVLVCVCSMLVYGLI